MIKKIREISGNTAVIIREYPMVLVLAFLAAMAFIFSSDVNSTSRQSDFVFMKFGMVALLGISLLFGLKMLSQRIGKGILLEVSGIIFLIFFYFLLPAEEKEFTEQYAFLLIPTFILSHLFVSFIAFFGEKKELNFWQYNKNLFINIFLTAVFTGVLIGGVELAILAVDKLFDFNFDGYYYSRTFYFLSIFGSCFIFLLFNDKGLQNLEKDANYPQILKFFTQYILIPLLLIYAVILYLYGAKILINWELPRGWVSYLVLAYSVVGILGLLLVHPLKDNSSKSWVKVFSKMFYYTLIPLIILLFTAIFTRILQYGYTEPRYFVLLLAVWLSSVVFYFVFAKNTTIKFIPVSLFLIGFFALTCPYFNAFSVAKRSQKTELMITLKVNNLLKQGKISFSTKIKSDVADEISNKIQFLAKRNQADFVLPLLSTVVQREVKRTIADGNFYNLQSTLRNQFKNVVYDVASSNTVQQTNTTTLIARDFNVDISGYQYLFKVYNYKSNYFDFDKNTVEIKMPVSQFGNELNLVFNGQKYNMVPDLIQLFNNYPNLGENYVDQLYFVKTIGNYDFKIMFDSVILVKSVNNAAPQFVINSDSILILIKKN